jgi:hypothetical protein
MLTQSEIDEKEGSDSISENVNLLKVRDDDSITEFKEVPSNKFKTDSECSWLKSDQEFGIKDLRHRIEPWLTSLFQSEHLSLLVGSGLTHAVHLLATGSNAGGMDKAEFTELNSLISSAVEKSAKEAGREKGNIEDQIRIVNELIRGLEILGNDYEEKSELLRKELRDLFEKFAKSILKNELNLATAEEEKRENAFNILVNFLMSFASRTGTRDRLNIFTTNYDRLIEAGSELAGLHLLDRFLGNLMPIFRSSRLELDMHYNPPGIRGEPRYLEGVARFTKLHGSVDWVQVGKDIRRVGIPFGVEEIDPYIKIPVLKSASACELMIYPNSSKDRETTAYPYVELFRDFAAVICRPNNTLVTYGYSFGDEHVNRIIEDMLTIPSTHLVIISYDDPLGRIISTYNKIGRPSQITLLIGNHLGDLKNITEHYLPKSAIDKATFRMNELLKQRFGNSDTEYKRELDIEEMGLGKNITGEN